MHYCPDCTQFCNCIEGEDDERQCSHCREAVDDELDLEFDFPGLEFEDE